MKIDKKYIGSVFYERALAMLRKKSSSEKDVKEAASLLLKAHKDGDRRATYALGTWYLHGRFFEKNERRGLKMIERAARAFVPDAMHDLAFAYETSSIKSEHGNREAYRYYLLAAIAGVSDAKENLAWCIGNGIGVEQDKKTASLLWKMIRK